MATFLDVGLVQHFSAIFTVLLVFVIVTIPRNPSDMTANLQGPVIINPRTRKGRQVISQSDRYGVRHRILDEIKKKSGGEG